MDRLGSTTLVAVTLTVSFGCEYDREVESPEPILMVSEDALGLMPPSSPPESSPAPNDPEMPYGTSHEVEKPQADVGSAPDDPYGNDGVRSPPIRVDFAGHPVLSADDDGANAADESDEDAITQGISGWEDIDEPQPDRSNSEDETGDDGRWF
jgi:hypothetical protein